MSSTSTSRKQGIFRWCMGCEAWRWRTASLRRSTTARIAALVADGHLAGDMGTDLTDSLHFFMGLKLKAGLAELDTASP